MTEAEHDMLRDNTSKIATLEAKINGIVPEQCITTKTTLVAIEKNQEKMSSNISKLLWAVVLAAIGVFTNLIANNIRWDQPSQVPSQHPGAAQSQPYERGNK